MLPSLEKNTGETQQGKYVFLLVPCVPVCSCLTLVTCSYDKGKVLKEGVNQQINRVTNRKLSA